MTSAWLALQTLTNLAVLSPGRGVPPPWRLTRIPHAEPPSVRVTAEHTLRIEAANEAGTVVYPLGHALSPHGGGAALSWRWRTSTPVPGARLRDPASDDAPVRVVVVFDDGRTLAYAWGNAEAVGDVFAARPGTRGAVAVCRRSEDANGSWYLESHDPFADYRRAFNRAPHAIVAVGVAAETDHYHGHTVADVSDLSWE